MTGTALQVFYNLNSLNKQVTEITDNYKKQLTEHIKSALDAKTYPTYQVRTKFVFRFGLNSVLYLECGLNRLIHFIPVFLFILMLSSIPYGQTHLKILRHYHAEH